MRLHYDPQIDAFHLALREATVTTEHLGDGVAAEYDAGGRLVGLEILDGTRRVPFVSGTVAITYDAETDVLYVTFTRPPAVTDSELTDDDVIVRYVGDEVVGYTILHASKRTSEAAA